MVKKLRYGIISSVFCLAGLAGSAQAGAYSDLVIFGDSISDTGNVLSLTTAFNQPHFPTFPGSEGRFSNGPVWTEYFAAALGLPGDAAPSNLIFNGSIVAPIGPLGGMNYSYGGARTGLGGAAAPTAGLIGELISWNGGVFSTSLTRAADADALYVVMVGANDLRDIRNATGGSTPADQATRAVAAADIAGSVARAVGLLAQAGAKHFLVSNLPDLGKTPEAVALGSVAASTEVTLAFNAALAAATLGLDGFFLTNFGIDLDIRTLDFYGLLNRVTDDAINNGGGVYGITNVSSACITPGQVSGQYFAPDASDGGSCDVSAYSDPLHPSAASHRLIADLAIGTVLPEPGSLALVVSALCALGFLRRRSATAAIETARQ